jgi:hypothetical protein
VVWGATLINQVLSALFTSVMILALLKKAQKTGNFPF